MPLVIRELNIKVNVGPPPKQGTTESPGGSAGGRGQADDAATIQRAVEEILRIDTDRKER